MTILEKLIKELTTETTLSEKKINSHYMVTLRVVHLAISKWLQQKKGRRRWLCTTENRSPKVGLI